MAKKKVNVMIEGIRVRQYVYFEKEDKLWIKQQAAKLGVSVSKYIGDLVQREIEKDIKLDLKFKG